MSNAKAQTSLPEKPKPLPVKYLAVMVHRGTKDTEIFEGQTRVELKAAIADKTDWQLVSVIRGRRVAVREQKSLNF